MAFTDSFETILNRLLTAYQNQDPAADISKGSLLFIRATALASIVWGLNKSGAYVDSQRSAISADEETLDHYIALRLVPLPSETLASKRARVIDDIRHPPAGGNKYDYPKWAKAASPLVTAAWCVPMGQGPGTVDIIILADVTETGSEIPTNELLAIVRDYIVDICPDQVQFLRVLAPEVLTENITIDRQLAEYPAASATIDVTNYLAGFIPGQPLYQDQLKNISLGGGDGKAPITTPADDVIPTAWQMIRPGVINVT